MEKIFVQKDLCDGCLDCVNACTSIHQGSRIKILDIDDNYYSIVCQQCENAPCKKICPTEAIDDMGVDENKCIGCGLCQIICPFGSITIEKVAQKCNMCADTGQEPACIAACSKRAISKMDADSIIQENQKKYIEKLTGANEKISPKKFMDLITSDSKASKDLE
ncbi:4Fe-4S dicluster domain-containing protein [Methanobrevibacter sp. DSM 116169]|uniref:4Fe-4S dicluster domain-containing protein n=1 Tax=Methanobrevibacter sp. DSM 116169 TaxID=3242727 RepID=UPI0038FC212F